MGLISRVSSRTYRKMANLEPDEEQYLKLAHLAGVPMSTSTLKAIKSLCEIGCDPNQIVATIETIAQNKIKAKEHAAMQKSSNSSTSSKQHFTSRRSHHSGNE